MICKEDQDLANCLVLLSNNAFLMTSARHEIHEENFNKVELKGNNKFQCKTCNKIFDSHQALGGHRASHKKVKGCFASTDINFSTTHELSFQGLETRVSMPSNIKRKRNKSHECSICHRIFASGQALGGHKRCHWISPGSNFPNKIVITNSLTNLHDEMLFDDSNPKASDLDLFPMVKDNDEQEDELKFEDENCEQQNMKKLRRMSDLDEQGSNLWLQMGISSSSTLGETSFSNSS